MMSKQKKQAIVCIILAAFFFSLMNLFVKLSGNLPIWQKSLFRNLVAFFAAGVIMLREHSQFRIGKANIPVLLMRCIAGTVGILCNFYAVGHLNIADASMLNKMSPFFATLFSVFLLKEKPKKTQWGAIIVAFFGTLFVIKPTFNMESIPAFFGLLGGLGAGAAYACVRLLGKRGVRGSIIVFCFSGFSCLAAVPGILLTYQSMTAIQVCYLVLAGAAAAGGQFSITAAYVRAPAKEISVFDYTQVIFAAFLSFVVFGTLPDPISFIGYAVIIASAIFKWRTDLVTT